MGTRDLAGRRHSAAFKVEAVRLMHERRATGVTLRRVSEELDLDPDLLRQWAKQVAAAPPGATPEEIFPGHGHRRGYAAVLGPLPETPRVTPEQTVEQELARLRRENERLRQERDFLKKATAFFAKESP